MAYGGEEEEMQLWVYDFDSVAKATNNFSDNNKLGQGGFGPVYKVNTVGLEVLFRKNG